MSKAVAVHATPFEHANREAYEAANNIVLASIDSLVAVWDGNRPEGIASPPTS